MTFQYPEQFAYRRDTNLRDSLVSSDLQSGANTGDKPNGTFLCRRPPCKTCAHTNPATQINTPGRPLIIRQRFSCMTSNLVYIITCWACPLSYVGETGRRLGTGSANTSDLSQRKLACPSVKIFPPPGHTTDDTIITLIVTSS